jgi:hypothetical protein
MNPSRETIAAALFALLNTATMKTTFKTISRRPKVWDETVEMPSLYLAQPEEEKSYGEGTMTPGKITIKFDVIVYTNSGLDPNVAPDTELNNCIDAIEAAMVATPPNQPQTLGGLVQHAWIEGQIQRAPGYLDGRGAAFMTISVLVP